MAVDIVAETLNTDGTATYQPLIRDYPSGILVSANARGKVEPRDVLMWSESQTHLVLSANSIKPQVFQVLAVWLWYIYKSVDEQIHELILPYDVKALWDFCQAFERLAKIIMRRAIEAPLYMELFRHFYQFRDPEADVWARKVYRALIRGPGQQFAKIKHPYFMELSAMLKAENQEAYLDLMDGYQKSVLRITRHYVRGVEGKKREKGPEDHSSSATYSGSDSDFELLM